MYHGSDRRKLTSQLLVISSARAQHERHSEEKCISVCVYCMCVYSMHALDCGVDVQNEGLRERKKKLGKASR